MKLIVQIPCLNEEATLPATLAEIPRKIPGIDTVEILLIDDGCSDRTVEVARQLGVEHILSFTCNQGLGRAFRAGLDQAVKLGADIIVNTDGDGQYVGHDIPLLIKPIIQGQADIVIGDRQLKYKNENSMIKKSLQWFGSYFASRLSDVSIPDAVSGFRAISRSAALKLNILSRFSYTLEMIIQAGNKRLNIVSVPIRTNKKTRESRLFRSTPHFVIKQFVTMLRMYIMYRPLRFFVYISALLSFVGIIPVLRFLIKYMSGDGSGNIQSIVLGGVFLTAGLIFFIAGLLSDLISQNRQLSELSLTKIRKLELQYSEDANSSRVIPEADRD